MTRDPNTTMNGAVAVVTGADQGLGPHFVAELLRRGAATVHALTRARLDVTDPDAIARAAARAPDATFVVNNEVRATGARLVDGDLHDIDLEMEVNFYGALGVTRAFAPVLIANGGGTILNVHAAAHGALAVTEAAACAMTPVVRAELAGRGVRVAGLHVVGAALGGEGHRARLVGQALDDLAAGALDLVAGAARAAAA